MQDILNVIENNFILLLAVFVWRYAFMSCLIASFYLHILQVHNLYLSYNFFITLCFIKIYPIMKHVVHCKWYCLNMIVFMYICIPE